MIKEIHMKSCAPYDETGISLCDMQRINFIYGPNGSGKSTISNFLQNTTTPRYSQCQIEWDGSLRPNIMVYNRRFKEENFQNGNEIAGVFTLGSATISEKKKLQDLKEKQAQLQKQYDKQSQTTDDWIQRRRSLREDFKDTIWNTVLKGNGKQLSAAFSGFRNNKEKFCTKMLTQYHDNHDSPYTLDQLLSRTSTLFSTTLEPCPLITTLPNSSTTDILNVERNDIFSRVIIGSADVPIAKLIHTLHNDDWVNRGRNFLHSTNICPFCQQKIVDESFSDQLHSFFDGEYTQKKSELQSLLDSYENNTTNLITLLNTLLESQIQLTTGKIDIHLLETKINHIQLVFAQNISIINEKIIEPGRIVVLTCTEDLLVDIFNIIRNANTVIAQHNQVVADVEHEREVLVNDVWTFFADEQEVVISSFIQDDKIKEKAITGMTKKLTSLDYEIKQLQKEIDDASKNITSVQPTVNEINRSLSAYGFKNFSIQPSKDDPNMYQILRPDGTLAAHTLSEGEETFITFLYFMQLAKGSVDALSVANKRILVIDDPICSLDNTVLYVVSAMIKNMIRDVKEGNSTVEQIIILTHNIFFHKEASFVNGRANPDPNVHFWTLYKEEHSTTVQSYERINPIHTSYDLLWEEIRSDHLTSPVTIQNTMRRIIENYFGMLGGNKEDYVVSKFSTSEDQIVCRSLFHWINDGSHSIPDDFYFDSDLPSIQKYKKIFHQIFIVTNNESHYNMMMGLELSAS